jgi:ATP-binding protein involved in chromosome partitioning
LPFAAQLCQNQRRIMKIRGATMALDQPAVRKVLAGVACPGGGDLISRDLVRALSVEGGTVRFVIESASPDRQPPPEPSALPFDPAPSSPP